MIIYKTVDWYCFEEVLALAMSWPLDEARQRSQQFDAAAGELPFEFPDRIDELIERGEGFSLLVDEDSAYLPDTCETKRPVSSNADVPQKDLEDYLFYKQRLKEAVKHDIRHLEQLGEDDFTVIGTVLNPHHVSRWLNIMQYRDMGKLHDQIVTLEKENTRLRNEHQKANKYDEDIASEYLDIAIKTYYKIWHNRDAALAAPTQEAIWSELQDDYPHLSEVTRKAIEKVCCPIERNPAKKKI